MASNIKGQERDHINWKFKSIVWTVKHDTCKNYKGLWRFRQFGEKKVVWTFYFDKTNYKFYILNFQNFTYLKNKTQGILDSKISGMNKIVPDFQVI